MADAHKATLDKLAKLFEVLREHQAKTYELTEEIQRLLAGEEGIGEKLKRLETFFSQRWQARYRTPYVWAFARDVPQLKRLLKMLPIAEIELRIARYLFNDDPYYVKVKHNFGIFVSSINEHAADALPIVDAGHVRDCKHVPACTSDQEHTKKRSAEMRGDERRADNEYFRSGTRYPGQ